MTRFWLKKFQPEDETERRRCAVIIDKVTDPNIRQLTLRRLILEDEEKSTLVVLAWSKGGEDSLEPLYSRFLPVRLIYVSGHPADLGMWDGFSE